MRLKRLLVALLLGLGLSSCDSGGQALTTPTHANCDNEVIFESFANQRSDVQVLGCGTITKVLPDDTKGGRHQRLIVALTGSKQTVLIAHNIDLAPRVHEAQAGDVISFYGEYEYNAQGGVVHWTHKDPAGRHQHGWIDKQGVRYE